ncbi:hypothetical protein M2093_000668 [Breznakia sp. PH1-1]|nr:hypothetical protein [Breznakia sp. PH1-1]MDH6403615.1 hypothetical protein [Breznakia sp. PF1-11]MDH6411324.1 hypothetical protein [Breznakia sp. PFB1-11]MDH6413700.1 hypothetical protein [Breznakia sp. PFB1-14]MDH6415869.1 hypothetical protein [Breznakia sp. PFB1-4]MDH6418368.1 hypothetical protein [Breznakia sp. PFB1-12]MDH6473945.1 hypothetical protein [Breznakia sp. PFB2-30]MDH6475796.1 hypothetical protein [Breznakia sp. PFB1-19]
MRYSFGYIFFLSIKAPSFNKFNIKIDIPTKTLGK